MQTVPAPRYGPWVDQGHSGKWVSKKDVKLRVIAIPQAGMGAWAFHGWQEKLPKSVEMLPVELPGRNTRMMEPKPTAMHEAVSSMVDALERPIKQMPYVVLGHSLGAWMAFEVVAEILRRGLPPPLALIVSGARAAFLSALEHDADAEAPAIAGMPTSEAFWEHFERRYGKNPDLASSGVKQYVEPLLRSDFAIVENFEPSRDVEHKLPMALVACGCAGDNRFLPEQLAAWSQYVSTPAQFEEKWFDTSDTMPEWSTPHRYLVDSPRQFLEFLGPKCEALLAAAALGAYVVANKKGALVREGLALDSAQVGLLPVGAAVQVAEIVTPDAPGAKPRARLSEPIHGWLSLPVLARQA